MALEPPQPGPARHEDPTDRVDPDPGGLVTRAAAAARRVEPEPPEGWAVLADTVMSRVRGLLTLSEPVQVHTVDGGRALDEAGSPVVVPARSLVTAIRRLLQGEPTHAPEGIRLDLDDDHRLVGVDLALVAAYGVDLRDLADQVRAEVLDLVPDVVGPPPGFDAASVTVTIADVVDGDPNRV
jgi:uncharacterized alkaline shock family protein YloU